MRTIFSREEIAELKKNPCVFDCTDRSITYTEDFKKQALGLYEEGLSSKEIWRRYKFDISCWNKDYCKDAIRNWRRIVKKEGYEGLKERRGGLSVGRPKTKGLTDTDKIKRLELQVKYLKAENDFLTKLRAKRAE